MLRGSMMLPTTRLKRQFGAVREVVRVRYCCFSPNFCHVLDDAYLPTYLPDLCKLYAHVSIERHGAHAEVIP